MKTTKVTPAFPAGNSILLPHALAETVPGEMTEDEFIALCTSIKTDGQCNAIVLFEGKILDGRARYRAARKLEKEAVTTEFKGTVAQAAAFVLNNNLHRRQLNSMQKAVVGARFHLAKVNPMTQKDAAAAVGVGVATINLAVRLINSNNTPLIKRCEHGDATRAEIDEILFDRDASRQQAAVTANANSMAPADPDDLIGSGPEKSTGSNVVSINSGSGVIAGKRSVKGHTATETPASRCVAHFKGLTEPERKAFCEMAWPWLAPALRKAGKLPKDSVQPAAVAKQATTYSTAAAKKAAPKAVPVVGKAGTKKKAA